MAAEPRIYKYTDTGAPAPSSRYDALYEILKGCLVDGYGAQPAAGWSMVYDNWSTDGMATFTNAAQSGVLGVVAHTSGSYGCTLFIADAMVDATHAATARSGHKEVVDLPGLANQYTGLSISGYSSDYSKWVVVANENVCIVFTATSDTYLFTSRTSLSSNYTDCLAVGSMQSLRGLGGVSDAALGNFALMARYGAFSYSAWNGLGYGACLTDRSASIVAGDQYVSLWPYEDTDNMNLGRLADADGIVEMQLRPIEIWSGTSSNAGYMSQIGRLPMFLSSWELSGSVAYGYSDKFSTALLTDLVDVDGRSCYVAALPGNFRMLISMALEDWV